MTLQKKIKSIINSIYPNFFVKSYTSTLTKTRIFSGVFRTFPDFIIIGSQKCGTTSLYDYICKHSDVYPAITKQIHYFDFNYEMKDRWYRAFFPLNLKKYFIKYLLRKSFLTGEASPDYINHPYAPRRISQDLPNTKLIAIFRNPVERAYSNYQHNIRDKKENLSFEDALKEEENRTKTERMKLQENEFYYSENFRQFQYVNRGKYIEEISEWLKLFSKEQLLILSTEELETNPSKVLEDIFSFLNIKNEQIVTTQKLNVGKYSDMKKETREYLQKIFRPYNEQFYKLTEKDFNW